MDFDSDAFNRTLFFPRAIVSQVPDGASDHAVDVHSATLHLRVHHTREATTTTVLFFHGNGEVVADYDGAAHSFAAAGAQLAVVDYRGYGQSTGTPTLRAITKDARDVLRETLRLTSGNIIIMGRSLGSACANELYGIADDLHERVRGFVLESGFTSIARLAERRAMAAPPHVEPLFDPIGKLRRGRHPLLVLHGARDALVRPDEAQVAFDAAGTDDKELVMLEGRGHNDIAIAPAYWQKIASFIRRVA